MRSETRLQHRLFFALWPQADVAASLYALSGTLDAGSCARRIPRESLHMTLAFLGEVGREKLPALCELIHTLPAPAFTLGLDRIGCWPRGGIVWAGASVVSPALHECVAALWAGLKRLGFAQEKRDFAPHVTLFRHGNVRPFALAQPISWPVSAIVLVESVPGKGYHALCRSPKKNGAH
jgi:2'-5' RNA ligase